MTSIQSALARAKALAAHFQKVWHVVQFDHEAFCAGSGHSYEGDAMGQLEAAAARRWAMNHDRRFTAMHAVLPDGSSHVVQAPGT